MSLVHSVQNTNMANLKYENLDFCTTSIQFLATRYKNKGLDQVSEIICCSWRNQFEAVV